MRRAALSTIMAAAITLLARAQSTAISGRVVADVQLLHIRYEAGRRRLVPAGGAARVSDDLGRYRLYALPPGQYAVSATIGDVGSADLPNYTRSYFPGTPNASEARFVSIGASEDLVGIDFSMARTQTARVAGKMVDSAGAPTTGGTVQLMPSQRSTSVISVPIGARILPDGQFEFANVAPGAYVIQAYRGRSKGWIEGKFGTCLLYTSPSPRDRQKSRMPSSA